MQLLESLKLKATHSGVWGEVSIDTDARRGLMLRCQAKASAEPAEFRVFMDEGKVWVALVTKSRWLSQSIEADLVHTGDKLEDLIEEELVDQGLENVRLACQHFRDEDKLFTFRSALPVDPAHFGNAASVDVVSRVLLAYEAAFRPLGDMEADEDE